MIDWTRRHKLFVGIDSDGCAFDTMELKHKECFIPNFIRHYDLQGVSKYAREAAEFVNLYSKSRGINRFPALVEQLDWLRRRPEVQARRVTVAVPAGVVRWIEAESKLGDPALERAVRETADADLTLALAWSKDVNAAIADMVRGVPPFPYVRDCLERLATIADIAVVSATPNEALMREWEEHDMARYVAAICGQESGTKKETLAVAQQYGQPQRLMIGDAPGDYQAAVANQCLFFPINPGAEEESWERLFNEGIERLQAEKFDGDYQQDLLREFERRLPAEPPWPVS